MKYRITLNKPDSSEKLSRSFFGKLETNSRAETTERHSNMLFKLIDHQNCFQKSRASIAINCSPAIHYSPFVPHGVAVSIGFINSGHSPFTMDLQHAN